MSGNGTHVAELKEATRLTDRAFWIAIHRAILSLAAIIKHYKIDVLIDE
jgi:hypothetical protein